LPQHGPMSLALYAIGFWTFALVASYLKETTGKPFPARTIIKMIPAFLAALSVLLNPSLTLFYVLLMLALVLCGLGDIGMEYNILPGLGLFLFAHFVFVGNFLFQGLSLGPSVVPLAAFIACLAVMMVYVALFHRYLKSSSQAIPASLLRAVGFYAIIISLTLSTSLLLWLTSGVLLGFVPFVGACLFVLSDSLIGIREFHHHFRFEWASVMITYYLAIFLLSLSAVAYAF